ncbi:hypothetical protein II906_04485, partial [bacterium]|nr:hypothetical protein [bacterium]
MAVKTKDYTVNFADFTEEGLEIDANKKTAIRIDGLTNEQAQNAYYQIDANDKLIITYDSKKLIISNYTGIRYIKTDYVKNGKKETYNLFDIISNSKVDNTGNTIIALEKPYYNAKKLTFTGTKYNDDIRAIMSNYEPVGAKNINANRGLTINAGDGNDYVFATNYNDVINGGNGNDMLQGNQGDDTITGGKGNTHVAYSWGDGNDVINLTKGENLILEFFSGFTSIDDFTFEYANKNKDLKISYDKNGKRGSVLLKNFAKKDVTSSDGSVKILFDGVYYDLRSNLKDGDYIFEIKPAGNFTGGWMNDHINATTTPELLNKRGKHVDLSLKGGKGDDLIESSMFADKITGGAGSNTIRYTSPAQLDGDKIYLTKGEKLSIDISAIVNDTENVTYTISGKNLVVSIKDIVFVDFEELTITEYDNISFTIMNFGTKDVTNNATKKAANTSEVNLVYGSGENDFVDLRNEVQVISKSGTWHNDLIDQHTYYNKKGKGLKINGKAGNDEIIGSDYSDTIKGGAGNDTITAGVGSDKLYGEVGNNKFIFNSGDGNDIIYNGKGTDTLKFANCSDLKFTVKKKDLIISYNNMLDSVTIKNYFDKKGIVNSSVKFIELLGKTYDIETLRDYFNNPNFRIIADNYEVSEEEQNINHVIIASNDEENPIDITTGSGNDTIYGSDNGSANINAGGGDNEIHVGNNSTVTAGSGDDTIQVQDGNEIHFGENHGNDVIIFNGEQDNGNTVVFDDKTSGQISDNVNFTKNGDDLVMDLGENGNSVTFE